MQVKNQTSIAWRGIDPSELVERDERMEHLRLARAISKLPEEQWADKVRLEPTDQQEEIWFFLRALRTVRQLCPRQ